MTTNLRSTAIFLFVLYSRGSFRPVTSLDVAELDLSRQSSEEPGRSGRSLASAGDVAYASLTPTRSPVFHGPPVASADDPVSAFSNTFGYLAAGALGAAVGAGACYMLAKHKEEQQEQSNQKRYGRMHNSSNHDE